MVFADIQLNGIIVCHNQGWKSEAHLNSLSCQMLAPNASEIYSHRSLRDILNSFFVDRKFRTVM